MNPSVLNVRGVRPVSSVPGKIRHYCLSFRLRGIPFIEPGFGTLERMEGKVVHGVVHQIKRVEWERIKDSEGVTRGIDGQSQGYYDAQLPVTLYGGGEEMASTLLSNPSSLHLKSSRQTDMDARFIDFCELEIINASFPSRRYKKLLVDGARHHRLDSRYQSWLEQLTAFEDSPGSLNSSGRALASMSSLALAAGLVGPAVALGLIMDLGGGASQAGRC